MLNDEAEVLTIYRRLTPKHQIELLTCVRKAYVAEKKARQSIGLGSIIDINSSIQPQDFSCGNSMQRSKK
jgi:hypothetical protein